MRWYALLAGASLASSVMAAPQSSIKALVSSILCDADICLRAAILVNPASSNSASASANCAKFMTKTVSPCMVTTTLTFSSTVTASPVTQTLTATSVSLSTSVSAVTNIDVNTVTTQSTLTIITLATVTTTQTSTATATITSVQGGSIYQKKKRDVDAVAELEKRTTAAPQCPSTSSLSTIPGTFSTCGNTSRYSSACSCFGVTAGVKTLPAVTTTSLTTTTQTTTPTVSVTITTVIGSVIQTTTTTVAQLTTTTTNVVTTTQTSTITTTKSTTITYTFTSVLPPFPTTFKIFAGVVNNGLYGTTVDDQYEGKTGAISDIRLQNVPASEASLYQIRNGNQLWSADGLTVLFAPTEGGVNEMVPLDDTAEQAYYHLAAASLGAYDNNAGGLALTISNPEPNESNYMQLDGNDNILWNYIDNSLYADCPPLFAVAA